MDGKELDQETGYYYYGARYYDPSAALWIGVDPLQYKYPDIGAYVYCAGNPVKYVDPDGRKLMITDSEGNSLEYSAGMQYKGNDSAVKEQVGVLNQMNGVENGQKVLSTLINSDKTYNITNGRSANGTAGTIENNNGATIRMNNENDFISVSHELFHCYQYDKGQGGQSIHNEVESYLYSTSLFYSVYENIGVAHSFYTGISGSTDAFAFENATRHLQFDNSFSNEHFNTAVSLFKKNSGVNTSGTYDAYPLRGNNQRTSLLKSFYPLVP